MKGLRTGNSFDFSLAFHSSSVILSSGYHLKSSDSFGRFQGPFLRSHFQTLQSLVYVHRSFILISSLKALSPFLLRRDFCLDVVSAGVRRSEALCFYSSSRITLTSVFPGWEEKGNESCVCGTFVLYQASSLFQVLSCCLFCEATVNRILWGSFHEISPVSFRVSHPQLLSQTIQLLTRFLLGPSVPPGSSFQCLLAT